MTKLDEFLDEVGRHARILFLADALMREVERQGLPTSGKSDPNYRVITIHDFGDTGTFEVRSGWADNDWRVSWKRDVKAK